MSDEHDVELEATQDCDEEIVEEVVEEVEGEVTEEVEGEVTEEKKPEYVTKKDLDDHFDRVVGAIAQGTQSQLDKGLDRLKKEIRPQSRSPVEEVVVGYCESRGVDVGEVLAQTADCKTVEEAMTKIVSITKGMKKTKTVAAEEEEPTVPEKKGTETPTPTKNVVVVPKVVRKSGGQKPSRDQLRQQFIDGELDNQQYSDKLKKFGYSTL